jgi:hypothetical protein
MRAHDRRFILTCGCSFAFGQVPPSACASEAASGGCAQLGTAGALALEQLEVGQNSDSYAASLTSGDTRLDASLGVLLADIAGRFHVRPGFAFYDDGGAPNAKALTTTAFVGTSGTVLCGRTLLATSLADSSRGDLFITSVLAHEFGHILQNVTSYSGRLRKGQSTVKAVELHADFLAGFYICVRGQSYPPQQMTSLGQAWEALGDSDYTNPQHHGTAAQRIAAMEAGYRIAHERPAFDALDMCEVGARYLDKLS